MFSKQLNNNKRKFRKSRINIMNTIINNKLNSNKNSKDHLNSSLNNYTHLKLR